MVVKNEIKGQKDHLLFDIDGTLIYFNDMSGLVKEAFLGFRYEIDDFERRHLPGVKTLLQKSRVDKNYFSIDNHALEQQNIFGIPKEDSFYLVNKLLEVSPRYIKAYPNVLETIRELNMDSFCVSDWFKQTQYNKLKEVGLEQLFRIIYTCEGSYAKPNIKRFEEILSLENLNPSKCVMIGDSINDLGASKMGINTILIDHHSKKKSIYQYADAVITEIKDLPKILRR